MELKAVKTAGNDKVKGQMTTQYSTFLIAKRLYGIDVTKVQEVVRTLPMTRIPLAANYVRGLINLRGQVATAIGLRQLFELESGINDSQMNVVCKCDGNLVSLLVDEIGDVIEVPMHEFEQTPATVPPNIKRFMSGVYKTSGALLSILDIEKISKFLDTNTKDL
jgi:purine-binding chemotaxis protein CheW